MLCPSWPYSQTAPFTFGIAQEVSSVWPTLVLQLLASIKDFFPDHLVSAMKYCCSVCNRDSISNSSTGGHQGTEAVEMTKGCERVKRAGKTESVDSPRERAAVIEPGKVPESCQALRLRTTLSVTFMLL